ncbi:MAG TPA: hypothetical protein VM240_06515 [Verrucomicrobiae bacterium]|nr:hypothetical protein [Verrucomicrobiae bacterium]
MSGHEARINEALKQLGEEFRLGMVQAEEYRARRRLLLESWGERDATTSPGSLRARASTTLTHEHAPRSAAPAPPRKGVAIAVGVLLAAMITGAGYLLLRRPPPAAPAVAPTPVAPALSVPAVAARKAADEFLAANVWEAAAIEGFLSHWRNLSADDRAMVSEQPSLRTLRYELTRNIEAETQLVGPDATPEQRQRLATLESFARELGTEGP